MTTNTKISNLVSSQVPFFVRNDHQKFVRFIEAYYEYLEQNEKTLDRIKNLKNYYDVDSSESPFIDQLYNEFLKLIPQNTIVDKALLLKHVKDFYRARGTEKSITFLLQILFNPDKQIFYYLPKRDILRASDGKWYIEKSLRVKDIKIDGVINDDNDTIQKIASSKVKGNTSGATAIVESVDVYYEKGTLVRELKLSNQVNNFGSGETLFTLFIDGDKTRTFSANVFSGVIIATNIINAGSQYTEGTNVPIESNTGSGGIIQISGVTKGNLKSASVLKGGAGFQNLTPIIVSGGGGTGAAAIVSLVDKSGTYHPNSYNIVISLISSEANTAIGNSVYSNLNSSLIDPANNWIANSMNTFVYGNCGPVELVSVTAAGNNYTFTPSFDISSNTRVRSLGILGRMEIINGGLNYQVGDTIEFNNIIGGYGTGASANVTTVAANGMITEVKFVSVTGHYIGGSGYDQSYLPKANVVSGTGSGANIAVTAIIGDGENLTGFTDTIGAIQKLTIISGGVGYNTAPTLNLTSIGDGTAQANVEIITGIYTYPGRYLNDDGHVSGYNFLEDRDYYQNYSYVIRSTISIKDYRAAILQLSHPGGMKLFGEFMTDDENIPEIDDGFTMVTTKDEHVIYYNGTYAANLGNVIINKNYHGQNTNSNVYIEFISGDTINISNGLFVVTTANANTFYITHPNTTNTSGNVYLGLIA